MQLSQVYRNMHMSNVLSLAVYVDRNELEKVLIAFMRHNLHVRLDHAQDSIFFDQVSPLEDTLATLLPAD